MHMMNYKNRHLLFMEMGGIKLKSIIRTMILLGALAFVAVPVQAQDSNLYAGGGLGFFTLDSGVGTDTVAGGYASLGTDISENFGAEVRLGTTGTANTQAFGVNVNYTIDYFLSGLGKAQMEVMDDLRAYGLLGLTYAKASASAITPVPGVRASGTNTSLSFGVGFDYRIADTMTAGAEWVAYASDVSGFVGTIKIEF